MTLTEFLRTRLAEDEWEAQRALSTLTNEINHARLLNLTSTREEILAAPHLGAPIRRMFAEVEAKRRIVELHQSSPVLDHYEFDCTCGFGDHRLSRCSCGARTYDEGEWRREFGPCPTLAALALPYVDHPDYQEEWKP